MSSMSHCSQVIVGEPVIWLSVPLRTSALAVVVFMVATAGVPNTAESIRLSDMGAAATMPEACPVVQTVPEDPAERHDRMALIYQDTWVCEASIATAPEVASTVPPVPPYIRAKVALVAVEPHVQIPAAVNLITIPG